MPSTNCTAEGRCPYCGNPFEKHGLHEICDTLACFHCGRWFVVKTHITVTHTTHRIEGEATQPYGRRFSEVA